MRKKQKDVFVLENFLTAEESKSVRLVNELILLREKKGITQKDLSNKAGLTQGQLSRIENYECSPSLETYEKLANALEKEVVLC
ncbi:helix-turn-helix domain-containing protein [Mammaliicoccus sciuri]|uniref:helix-turn-helix domain-containing protein n=1 Tax=Mammaliicoccus sciuri TaxID=1296 RepID=UPI001FB4E7C4|nr:helix-turn-helix transcriptional regulator [Mammaliicoccus sciuri]MCJ0941389.1 helix-turn-helix domain-containing protein [Mammaliicoccus sciuri]